MITSVKIIKNNEMSADRIPTPPNVVFILDAISIKEKKFNKKNNHHPPFFFLDYYLLS